MAELLLRSTNSQCFFSGWAKNQINQFAMFLVAELRYTTKINEFAMFFSDWATKYDKPIRHVFNSGRVTIYDPGQPIFCDLLVAELRSTTKTNQYAMFVSVAELRQLSMLCQWLSYDVWPGSMNYLCLFSDLGQDIRPRSTNLLCLCSGWNNPALPIPYVFSVAELRHRSTN